MNSSKFEKFSPQQQQQQPQPQPQPQHSATRTGMMQMSSISKFEPATSLLARRASGHVGSSKFEPDSSHAVATAPVYISSSIRGC
jgi:hypothetical protein